MSFFDFILDDVDLLGEIDINPDEFDVEGSGLDSDFCNDINDIEPSVLDDFESLNQLSFSDNNINLEELAIENNEEIIPHHNRPEKTISFMGVGRCSCGCGSFIGCSNICNACGHPYSSHSRYK